MEYVFSIFIILVNLWHIVGDYSFKSRQDNIVIGCIDHSHNGFNQSFKKAR
jgi:hypothetical protein